MVDNFDEFSDKIGKLTIEGDVDLGEVEENWNYILDISNIWNENELQKFCNDLYTYIQSIKDDIINNVNLNFYEELENLVKEIIDTNNFILFDKIYDLCDSNNVKIEIE